jgi:phage baseplate assembly protein W
MRNAYLGTSLTHPVDITSTGQVGLISGRDNVQQSIKTILSTPQGSRFYLPEFGSKLHELYFEINDDVLEAQLEFEVREALGQWEKRIKVLDVSASASKEQQDLVNCFIAYEILQSNDVESMVYPFYKKIKY